MIPCWIVVGVAIQHKILTPTTIQHGILTRGLSTEEGVKIQQRDQNSTAKEGHYLTKYQQRINLGRPTFNPKIFGIPTVTADGVSYNLEISFF